VPSTLPALTTSITYGCATKVGHEPAFVEATLTAQTASAANPLLLQVGLAQKSDNSDALNTAVTDGGPTLVLLQSQPVKFRLAVAPTAGDHLYIRQQSTGAFKNFLLPTNCQRVSRTDFDLSIPQLVTHPPTCGRQSESTMLVSIENLSGRAVNYTLLLVRDDGQLVGEDPWGTLVPLGAYQKASVTLVQPSATIPHQYTARVIGPDGSPETTGAKTMFCESTGPVGNPHPTVKPTLVTPSVSPTPTATTGAPTPTATASSPGTSTGPGATSTASRPTRGGGTTTTGSTGSGQNGSGQAGSGQSGDQSSGSRANGSGPVLGDADSTSKPSKRPASSASKHQTLADLPAVSYIAGNPGMALGALAIVLLFAAVMGTMLAVNGAGARRR
jgi:hypothetical protein